MLTIICDSPGTLSAIDRPKPTRGEGEVLVRIRRVGVCGTDLHIFTGNQPYLSYPRVMGHELAGVVEETSASSHLVVGDTVSIVPYISCGHCSACRKGMTNCCRNIGVLGVHRDGGMTEYLSLPEKFVLKADGLSLDQAAMVEFLAIGAHAVSRARVEDGQKVLVVGAGPIGMAVAIFARLNGGEVTLLDGRTDRLDFATNYLDVPHTVKLGDDDTETLSEITGGDFFDVVFDATGNAKAMERGFDPEFHKRETSLLGSRNATVEDFERVMEAMRAGAIPEALITHRMTLPEVPERFAGLTDPAAGVVKAIVEI